MRRVLLDALVRGVGPDTVYDSIIKFERYAELAPHVQSAVVHQTEPEPTGRSSWDLRFRSGLLHWTEQERFLRDQLIVEFSQEDGDFDEFTGRWVLRAAGPDTEVHFEADFDFGIPSMESILDPIAERVIRETVAWTVTGMFDDVHLYDVRSTSGEPGAAAVVGE